jgi:hypothetical protein
MTRREAPLPSRVVILDEATVWRWTRLSEAAVQAALSEAPGRDGRR